MPVGSNLRCVVLMSKSYLNQNYSSLLFSGGHNHLGEVQPLPRALGEGP